MVESNVVLSSSERCQSRAKHVGLTKFLRRHYVARSTNLKNILYRCDVSPYLGALPPELRACIPHDKIPSVTYEFRQKLEDFLINNICDLKSCKQDTVYNLSQLGDLFNTRCEMTVRGIGPSGCRPWQGGIGYVCKLSFPQINAHYALKLFDEYLWNDYLGLHGPWYETATALVASHSEPGDNNKIYMASLIYEKYMLSAWGGDAIDNIPKRNNKNEIFVTGQEEDVARNWRLGRRIDWGDTYLTSYGSLSYRGRKLYRQIMNYDIDAAMKSVGLMRNLYDLKEAQRVVGLVQAIAWYDDDMRLENFAAKVYSECVR